MQAKRSNIDWFRISSNYSIFVLATELLSLQQFPIAAIFASVKRQMSSLGCDTHVSVYHERALSHSKAACLYTLQSA